MRLRGLGCMPRFYVCSLHLCCFGPWQVGSRLVLGLHEPASGGHGRRGGASFQCRRSRQHGIAPEWPQWHIELFGLGRHMPLHTTALASKLFHVTRTYCLKGKHTPYEPQLLDYTFSDSSQFTSCNDYVVSRTDREANVEWPRGFGLRKHGGHRRRNWGLRQSLPADMQNSTTELHLWQLQ